MRTNDLVTLAVLAWRSATQARFVVFGGLFVLAVLQIILVGQASALEASHSYSRMVEFVPAFLQRGLGSTSLLLVTFKGTVALGYFHPVVSVLISVLAVYFVTEPAHEVESGLVDITLARSVPRHIVVTRSLLLAFGAVMAAAVLMTAGTRLGLRLFASPEFDAPSVRASVSMLVHLVSVALCFGGFGLFVATGARRWSTAFTAVGFTVVIMYLVDFLAIGWPPMRTIAWISPFHYYPALSILSREAPDWRSIGILLSAATLFAILGYLRFNRRDL